MLKYILLSSIIILASACVSQQNFATTTSSIGSSTTTIQSVEFPKPLTNTIYQIAEGETGFFKYSAKHFYPLVKQLASENLPSSCLEKVNTGLLYLDMRNNTVGELTHGWQYYFTTGDRGLLVSVTKELDSTQITAQLTKENTTMPVSGSVQQNFIPGKKEDCIDFDSFIDHDAAGRAAITSPSYFSTSYFVEAKKQDGKDLWIFTSSNVRSPGTSIVHIFVDGKTGALVQ